MSGQLAKAYRTLPFLQKGIDFRKAKFFKFAQSISFVFYLATGKFLFGNDVLNVVQPIRLFEQFVWFMA